MPFYRAMMKRFRHTVAIALGSALLLLAVFQQWIVLGLLFGISIAVSLFLKMHTRPEIILTVCMILGFAPSPSRYFGYVLFMLVAFELLSRRGPNAPWRNTIDVVTVAWSCIVLFGLLTVPRWQLPLEGIQWSLSLGLMPLITYLMVGGGILRPEELRWILDRGLPLVFLFVVGETLIAAIIIAVQQQSLNNWVGIYSFRKLMIPDNGSNRLAALLVFISVFNYTKNVTCRREMASETRTVIVSLVALGLSLLIMSRGAIVGLGVAIAAFVLGKIIKDRRISVVPIIVMMLVLFVVAKPFIDEVIFRMQNVRFDMSTLYRLGMWQQSILSIGRNLVIGSGPGQRSYDIMNEQHEDPHNMVLRYGVEYGGIAALLIVVILLYPVILYIRLFRRDPSYAKKLFLVFSPALLGVTVHAQMDFVITSKSFGPLYWLVWSMQLRALRDHDDGRLINTSS